MYIPVNVNISFFLCRASKTITHDNLVGIIFRNTIIIMVRMIIGIYTHGLCRGAFQDTV